VSAGAGRVTGRSEIRVAISGGSGLVGTALGASLAAEGHRVQRLVRRPPAADREEVFWDPAAGRIDAAGLEGAHAVVNLAGENIAAGRWTTARKERIRSSRVDGTRLIAETLAALERPPRVLVNASAIGYYGDRGDEPLDETSSPGAGFLAENCVEWEAATAAARRAGICVVWLRIGVVLTVAGGALPRMLTPFRLGLGGRIGSGRQFMSWITLEDLTRVIHRAVFEEALDGPVNAVAPGPVRNAEFTRTLGVVLRRPTLLPLPAWAVRLLLGEMGQELLLASTRVVPARLEAAGFVFRHAAAEPALRSVLGRPRPGGRS
jgi:uncharacterized protein (TIGR01777 family)